MDTQSVDAAYHAGWDACLYKLDRTSNPHAPGTFERSSWDFGYEVASSLYSGTDQYAGQYVVRRK